MNQDKRKQYGQALFNCMMAQTTMGPLTEVEPEISIEDSYFISREFLSLRMVLNNERLVGKKIGVTSDAVQSMLGVYEPDFGFLTDSMQFAAGDVPIGNLIQPRAEAEIALVLSKDLKGPGITAADVLEATEVVIPCFEIVDSRIHDWQIKIQDTVADNASCGIFILGEARVAPGALDLAACEVTVTKNGEFLSSGLGSSVQGSPLQSVAWLVNTFGALDEQLNKGEIILSGSMVPLEPIKVGDVMELGSLACNFVA